MSVVVADKLDGHLLICKGAVEEVLSLCAWIEVHGQALPEQANFAEAKTLVEGLNAEGFRVVALAYKELPGTQTEYAIKDETDLTLLGFLAFLDPPKTSASDAIRALHASQVRIKVLTGDSGIVTGRICQEVGLAVTQVVLGSQIETMNDAELAEAVDHANVFARLSPAHKERIIQALQRRGHVVGFLGDGINDAPALRAADVGISVDSAVDIAMSPLTYPARNQPDGAARRGDRRAEGLGNIIKYVKMAASSNFGNMFSVVGGSLFLPFLPMLPMQIWSITCCTTFRRPRFQRMRWTGMAVSSA